jgi:uncharacterized protein (TIGR00299 family) protein
MDRDGRHAWFQCLAGASGDMLLGALIDAGAPLEDLQRAIDAVGTERVLVSASQVSRHGLSATKVDVKVGRTAVVRTWGNVRALLENAELPEAVRARAIDAFARLARAEAAVRRTSPDQVHFREAGALGAIAHVVGVCAALSALGVVRSACSPVALGQGMVRGEHGLTPVPAPSVVVVLSEAGAPVYSGDVPQELCTPTGAALLAAVVTSWGGLPPMRVRASGLGAGSRDLSELPNLVRVVLGDPAPLAPDRFE